MWELINHPCQEIRLEIDDEATWVDYTENVPAEQSPELISHID